MRLENSNITSLSNQPHLLLVSQPHSYRIAPYLDVARAMGLPVVIASRGQYSLVTEVHDGLHIDLDNPESAVATIIQDAQSRRYIGILGSDDSTVEIAALAARQLGLPHNPPKAANISSRKDLARSQLQQADCLVPWHKIIDLTQPIHKQLNQVSWPCVIKPINMSASRGVIRVNDSEECINAVERVARIAAESAQAFEQNHLLLEAYIDGEEVAFEGYLHASELHTLAIFDKPDPLIGPYFDETIYVTPSSHSESMQLTIKQRVKEACKAYGLTTGPVHAELRLNNNDAWILEVASRTIGGDCGKTLDNGQGFSIEELAISLAINKNIEVKPPKEASGVMMIPIKKEGLLRQVEGQQEARAIEHIESVDIIKPYGHELIPLPEGNQYLGYIFARAEKPQQVTLALRKAYSMLRIRVAPLFKLTRAE